MSDTSHQQTAEPTAPDQADVSRAVVNLEPLGGDPPCWAHLFEDDDEAAAANS